MTADERITTPLVREGTELMPASWEKAIAPPRRAQEGRREAAALAGGTTTNERRSCSGAVATGSSHSATPGGELPLDVVRALADLKLQATVPDLEFAHTVLLWTATRSTRRRSGTCGSARACAATAPSVAVASARPTALDPAPTASLRFAPGGGEGFLVALDAR